MSIKQLEDKKELVGEIIHYILEEKRMVMYGLSTNPKDFSHQIYQELKKHDYDIYAVNPKGDSVGEIVLHHPLDHIPEEYETAYIMVNPVFVEDIIEHCKEQGIKRIWLHRGVGQGAVSPEAVHYCNEHDLDLVDGACILMYLDDTALIHRVHRWISKLLGDFPILPN